MLRAHYRCRNCKAGCWENLSAELTVIPDSLSHAQVLQAAIAGARPLTAHFCQVDLRVYEADTLAHAGVAELIEVVLLEDDTLYRVDKWNKPCAAHVGRLPTAD
jgi:hypothetical protein